MAVPPGFGDFFLSAACKGDVNLLQSLSLQFDNGEGPGKVLYAGLKTPEGMTAIHLAAGSGTPEACTFLIDILGFDINSTCNRGETPLFSAIIQRNLPTAKFLISSGAEVTKRSKLGDTPLHCAANSGSKEIAMLLVSKGASVNAISQRGTPLGFAARCGHPDVLKYLLEQKADPNPKDSSPLSSALYGEPYPNIECVELLLKAGADPNYHCYLKTPLRIAASKLNEDMIRCLLRGGADPNMPDLVGYRPLEHAALLFRHKAVEVLFPVTSHVACYPDWSIRGVMKHVESKEAKTLFKSKQKEVALFAKTKGAEAYKQKNYLDAGNWFSEAIEADPFNAKVISNRSSCFAKSDYGTDALRDAQMCVSLKPDWAKAHYREGVAWTLLEDFKNAAKAFSQALVLDPGNKEFEKAYRAAQAELN